MKAIELFVGAGGLGMGTANAGFEHAAVIEWNHDACETIRANQANAVAPVTTWPLFEADARTFDFRPFADQVALVAGGPPCQPFSIAGKHRGNQDTRDMFPHAVRAVREIRPKAFMFENVRGLTRHSFAHYFEYILLQLRIRSCSQGSRTWLNHLSRLERHHTGGCMEGLVTISLFACLMPPITGFRRNGRGVHRWLPQRFGRELEFSNPDHTGKHCNGANGQRASIGRHTVF